MTRSRGRAVVRFWAVIFVLFAVAGALSGCGLATTGVDGPPETVGQQAALAGSGANDAGATLRGDLQRPSTGPRSQERVALAQAVDPDRTTVDVALEPDGDAAWTLEFRVELEDEEAREAFESLRDDVAADPENYTADFEQRIARTAAAASESTGREMAVENVTVTTRIDEIPHEYGVLTYELRWTNFAAVEDDALHAGDAVDGFPMEEGTRLTVRWSEAYELRTVTPDPDQRTATRATWRGAESEFVTGEPRLVVGPPGDRSWLVALGVAALLAVTGGGVWWLRRGGVDRSSRASGSAVDTAPAGVGAAADAPRAAPADGGSDHRAVAAKPGAGRAGHAANDESAGAGTVSGGAAGEDATTDHATTDDAAMDEAPTDDGTTDGETAANGAVPEELLSNEEQVLRVLEEQGGRAKQQQVVSELGWTEAKTSQVVTGMHDDGDVEKFRIGRENVLALPGEADL